MREVMTAAAELKAVVIASVFQRRGHGLVGEGPVAVHDVQVVFAG